MKGDTNWTMRGAAALGAALLICEITSLAAGSRQIPTQELAPLHEKPPLAVSDALFRKVEPPYVGSTQHKSQSTGANSTKSPRKPELRDLPLTSADSSPDTHTHQAQTDDRDDGGWIDDPTKVGPPDSDQDPGSPAGDEPPANGPPWDD